MIIYVKCGVVVYKIYGMCISFFHASVFLTALKSTGVGIKFPQVNICHLHFKLLLQIIEIAH
jgi:hypothetical protein